MKLLSPALLVSAGTLFVGPCAATAAEMPPRLKVLLEGTCLECHDDTMNEAGLNLTSLPFDLEHPAQKERWIRIFDRVEKGEMPPDAADLSSSDRTALTDLLGKTLADADERQIRQHGRGLLRRLNRDEFEQNLRDLLHLPLLDIRDMLPEDREGHHSNKAAETLDMSRVQLTAYLDAVEATLQQAMAKGPAPAPPERYLAPATRMFQEASTFGNREAMFYAKHGKMIPVQGKDLQALRKTGAHDPEVEMALFRSASWPYYGYPEGFLARRTGQYRVKFSARAVVQQKGFTLIPASQPVPLTFRARKPSGADVSGDVRSTGGIIDILPQQGEHETVLFLKQGETFEYSLLGLPVPLARNVNNGPPTYRYPPFPEGGQPGVAFQWIEVEGPLPPASWPPASHHVLFDDLPTEGSSVDRDPENEGRRLMGRFARLAARQPVPDAALRPYEELVLARLAAGSRLTEALLAGYKAFLCSVHFLYLHEPGNRDDHHAIAARLSHFLTNTRPDARLRHLADTGRLRDPQVLEAETRRLVADDSFERFVKSFTDYWLSLRHVRRDEPDIRLYPEYRFDDYLVESMEQETRAFFTSMVRENLPAGTVVESDFIYANDRLARHYRLPPLDGSAVRKVPVPPGSPYGGLITQAALLKVTSNGTTTSPVVRGAWVMERLLGEPPPPPPPSVPAVEPDIRGAATIRDLLALHTQSKSCASCHARFDPVGMALENFDILGGWRAHYRGLEQGEAVSGIDRAGHDYRYTLSAPVDAAGRLLDGREFRDIRELKAHLASQPRQLAKNLLHQMVLYATGTPVRFSERTEIESLLTKCAPSDYRVGDLLHALVQSPLFLGQPAPPSDSP